MLHPIVPSLWFDTEAEAAAQFYTSVFKNSGILNVTHYTEAGPREAGSVMTVEFELDGQRFVGINGGPQFTFDEAISFQITCETQDEVDYYWDKLTDGGSEVRADGSKTSSGSRGRWFRRAWQKSSPTPTPNARGARCRPCSA